MKIIFDGLCEKPDLFPEENLGELLFKLPRSNYWDKDKNPEATIKFVDINKFAKPQILEPEPVSPDSEDKFWQNFKMPLPKPHDVNGCFSTFRILVSWFKSDVYGLGYSQSTEGSVSCFKNDDQTHHWVVSFGGLGVHFSK